jgi:hypothetical protein
MPSTSWTVGESDLLPALEGDAARAELDRRGLSASLDAALESARYAARPATAAAGTYVVQNPAQGLRGVFAPDRAVIAGDDVQVVMWPVGIGFGAAHQALTDGVVTAAGPRTEIARTVPGPSGAPVRVDEWWINRRSGIEQGFTVQAPPGERASGAWLTVAMALETELSPRLTPDETAVEFVDDAGTARLRYDHLLVVDATGRELPSRMRLDGTTLRLEADDTEAVYPVTIDPTWTQQAYLKASNTGTGDHFGTSAAIAGNTVVVGAWQEDSSATGVDGDQASNATPNSGAAYVFVRDGVTWSQQAYLKASNPGGSDFFGYSVAIAGDTIVVGALGEASSATGVNGDQTSNASANSGAAYVFVRDGVTWSQQAYLKASNTDAADQFGRSVAVAADTIVVGALGEASSATGVNGNQASNASGSSGAAYVFVRDGATWSQQAYLKASNTGVNDGFGSSVALAGDTIVVGANGEDSTATGVNGTGNDGAFDAGAAYVFVRDGVTWSQQAYLKASNTGADDRFGFTVAVAGDTIVVGAWQEDSSATGVNGDQTSNTSADSGAAYVFVRAGVTWSQQAYLKASNTSAVDNFGHSVAVAGDTIVVAAPLEDGSATGVSGDQASNASVNSGAAYVFVRDGVTWSQQEYLKASNTGSVDFFGWSVAIAGDTVVVGAQFESSSATGVNGDQASNAAVNSGAVYVYVVSDLPPVADAGANQTVTATVATGASVTLDGSASHDPENTALIYEWRDASNTVVGNAAVSGVTVPLGVHVYTLRVTNAGGVSATGTVTITVLAGTTTSIMCGTPVTYTGAALTPCTATVLGVDGFSLSVAPSYENNVAAGTATASYMFVDNATHAWSFGTTTFAISARPITATLTAGNKTYDGTATEPDANMSCTVTGQVPGDVVTCAASNGVFNGVNAGATSVTATVTLGGDDAANYTLGAAGTSIQSTTLTAGGGAGGLSTTADAVFGQLGSFTTNTADKGGRSADSLNAPFGVLADAAGGVYIFEYGSHRVLYYPAGSTTATRVYGQAGSFTTGNTNQGGLSASSLNNPTSGALDSSGNLYVADQSNNRVLFFPSGSTTATRVYGQGGSFTTNSSNHGGLSANSLSSPQKITLDASGNLYVADQANSRVLFFAAGNTTATRVYGQNGNFNSANTSAGATGLNAPGNLAVDAGGNLYVSDLVNNRVLFFPAGSTTATRVYGQNGNFNSTTAGTTATSLRFPRVGGVDAADNLYIADQQNHRVLVYPSGTTTATRVYGQAGSFTTGTSNTGGLSANSLSNPLGASISQDGKLYVVDLSNNRILRFVLSTSAIITTAPVTATLTAAGKAYDGNTTAANGSLSCVVNGVAPADAANVTCTVSNGSFSSAAVGARTVTATVTIGGSAAGNYTFGAGGTSVVSTTADATTTITPRGVTVSGLMANNKTYDGTTTATVTSAGATLVGVLPGETVTLNTASAVGTFASAAAGVGKAVTVTGLSIDGANAGNYELSSSDANATANILTKPMSLFLGAQNKTYDGTTTASGFNCGLAGVLGADAGAITCTSSNGNFDGPNVGTHTVTATQAIGGPAVGNYTLGAAGTSVTSVVNTTTASIVTKPISVSFDAISKSYDGTTDATGASCAPSGVVATDAATVTCTVSSGTFDSANAGPRTVTATMTIGGSASGNYTLGATGTSVTSTSATGSGTILTRPMTVSLGAQDKTYDGTTSASGFGCGLTGVLPADAPHVTCTGSNGSFDSANAGLRTVTATQAIGGPASVNYTLGAAGSSVLSTLSTVSATIRTKALTASLTVPDKSYDGTTDANGLVCTLAGVLMIDVADVNCSGSNGAFAAPAVGAHTVTAEATISGMAAANYTLGADGTAVPSTSVTTTATIAAVPLTVSGIVAGDKIYDGTTAATVNATSAVLTGLVAGDVVTVNTGSATATFATALVGAEQTVNVTGLTLGGADAGNYALVSGSTTATASILTKPIIVSIEFQPKTYDGTTTASPGGCSTTGVLPADGPNVTCAGFTGAFDNTNAGLQTVNAISQISGSAAGNYTLGAAGTSVSSLPTTVSATIRTKPVTATFVAADKPYDGTTTAPGVSCTLAGVLAVDAGSVTCAGSDGTFDNPNPGLRTVTATATLGGSAGANYTLGAAGTINTSTTGTAPATIRVTSTTTVITCPASVAYTGSALTPCTATVTAADGFSQSVAVTHSSNTDAGTATATASFAGDVTYPASSATSTFAITPAPSATTISCPTSVVFAGSAQAPCTATVTGVGGLNTTTAVTYTNNTGVGTASATASYSGDTNHSASSDSTTFEIGRAQVSAVLVATGKVYDQTTVAPPVGLNCTVMGLVPADAGSVTCAASNGVFDSANAGTRTVTATVSISGAAASNYQLTTTTATALSVITTRPVTATLTASSKAYDGTATEPDAMMSCAFSGVLVGDTLTCTATNGGFSAAAVGSGGVTATVTLGGGSAGNYTLGAPGTTVASQSIAATGGGPGASTTAEAVYGQNGSLTSNIVNNGGVGATSIGWPHRVVADASGGLYVAQEQNNRVVYYPNGSQAASVVWGQGGSFTTNTVNNGGLSASSLNTPRAAVPDTNGNLYIVDSSNHRVLFYPAGSLTATRVYGQGGSFTSGMANLGGISADSLSNPNGVAVDTNGNVYIADSTNHRVLVYAGTSTTATGVYGQTGFATGAAGAGATGLNFPQHIVFDSLGNLYVSDQENNRIQMFAAGSTSATRTYGGLNRPRVGTLDASDNLYIADSLNSRVLFYPAGSTTATRVYGQGGSFSTTTCNKGGVSADSLCNPLSVAVTNDGKLYIADQNNHRLLRYALTGSGTITTAPVTVTLTAADKAYDGTTAAADAGLSCVLTGVIPAEAGDVACMATAGTFSSADAGARTVTATVTISGTAAGHYTLGAVGTAVTSSTASAAAAITPGASSSAITCTPTVTYTGNAMEVCTATVTGIGGFSEPVAVTYTNNVNAGTATATANFAGTTNHSASSATATFTLTRATSVTVVTCPTTAQFTSLPLTPCSATAMGVGGFSASVPVSYTNNTNSGTATATATFAGDNNHLGSMGAATFTIGGAAPGVLEGNGQIPSLPSNPTAVLKFDFSSAQLAGGALGGSLTFWTTDANGRALAENSFTSTVLASLLFADDPAFTSGGTGPAIDSVIIRGAGRWEGNDGYTFIASASDRGEPGTGLDTFALTVFDSLGVVVWDVGGTLTSGNVASLRLPGRNSAPMILGAPSDQIVEATSPEGAVVSYGTVTAVDNLGDPVPVICTPISGSVFPVGRTRATCTATDAQGLTRTVTFLVRVVDLTAPTFTQMPADLTVEADRATGAAVNYVLPTATDLVDTAVTVRCSPASGRVFAFGSTTVTCTATDNGNNVATSSFTVTVADTKPPVFTNPPSDRAVRATGPDGAVETYPTPRAVDEVDGAVSVSCTPTSGSTFPLGTTTVTCTATDSMGHSASITFAIVVSDTGKPVIDAVAPVRAEATGPTGAEVSYTVPTASDVIDSSVDVACAPASGSTFAIGGTTVTCTATDDSGNSATRSFPVTVHDTTPPVISGAEDRTVEAGTVVAILPVADDLVGGRVPVSCAPMPTDGRFRLGRTNVTCQAADASGNVARKVVVITGVDTVAPVVTLLQTTFEATRPGGYVLTAPLATARDLVDPFPTLNCLRVNTLIPLGTTTVNCTATDRSGNVGGGPVAITVLDRTPPQWTTFVSNITVTATAPAGASVNWTTPRATDIVSTPLVQCSYGAQGFPVGITTVTCTATDSSGNTATQGFNVTVLWPAGNPAITVPFRTTLPIQATSPSGASVNLGVYAVDATNTPLAVQCTPPSGNFRIGATTVTCTATDLVGRVTSRSFTVTVQDTIKPTVTLLSAVARGRFAMDAVVPVNFTCADTGSGVATCTATQGAVQVSPGQWRLNTSSVGNKTLTLQATDRAGNVTTTNVPYSVVR